MRNSGEREYYQAKEYELGEEMTRSLGREAIMNALSGQIAEIKMDDFTDVYSPAQVAADQRYVRKFERFVPVEEQELVPPAQIFERMFTNGVVLGNWLGNIGFEDGHTFKKFKVEAHNAAPYDDLRNRIDTFTTLTFARPIEDEDYGESINKVVMGFDVTTHNGRKTLLDKITRSYNSHQKRPFGFSQLRYYDDGEEHGALPLLPRYTIGLGIGSINAATEAARIRDDDGSVDFNLFSGPNLMNRFKILSEIRAENELYQAMLPDDMDSEIVQKANVQLYAVDQCLHDALEVCTRELVNRKCLPQKVLAEVENAQQKGRGLQARNIVQEYLLSQSQEIFDSESRERAAWGKRTFGRSDTFKEIIQLCDELKTAAYAGELDEYRTVSVHNQGIPLSKLTNAKA